MTVISSEMKCTLIDLRNFTEYDVLVKVCAMPEGKSDIDICNTTSIHAQRTLSGVPDIANITAVIAPMPATLDVHWMNPTYWNGEPLFSGAFAIRNGTISSECNGTTATSSTANCTLSGLNNYTEYNIYVKVCTRPEENSNNFERNYCRNSSLVPRRTLPCAPPAATELSVAAPAFGELEVRWTNPSNINGILLPPTAILRSSDGTSEAICTGANTASSYIKCSNSSLNNYTEYQVYVVVCTEEANKTIPGDAGGGGCTNSSLETKWTLPIPPPAPTNLSVAAPAFGELEVRWTNPSNINGILLPPTAILRSSDGTSEAICTGANTASSYIKCSNSSLNNYTEYQVYVVVCTEEANKTIPGDAGGGGCTNSSVETKWTLPIRTFGV
ncbi:unnamed protein product [Dibothriocephalus latus]|uniref:Fibronectin type-III domain-containing protein n=1 Tax=Dibothriocephalus latus TaxID=60516 RepID=A0A3P7NQK8_DIBLA|nr:unnamed protein product [Dibothriocephalus latus]